ncbi:MAG TPA: hypothetical protein PK855_11985 [Bacteroidales bacterium]|nr:hypothetical protein [Bacteroidales bacterium]
MKPTRNSVLLDVFTHITGVAAHAFTGFSVCGRGLGLRMNLRRLWWHENATID